MTDAPSAPSTPSLSPEPPTPPWRRAADGLLGGVCSGLAQRFDVEPWIVRFFWAMAAVCFGTGLFLYALCWICVPRADDPQQGLGRLILGVCARVARRGDVDIAAARLIAATLLLISGGAAVVGYLLLYFLLPEKNPEKRPENRPENG